MTQYTMDDRIVRYGELVPCKTAFIDAHTPGSDQKENFTIIGGVFQRALINMFTLLFRMASILVRQVNHQNAEILYTTIILLRFSSYCQVVGGFFGEGGVVQEKLCLSRAILLIYLQEFSEGLKILALNMA